MSQKKIISATIMPNDPEIEEIRNVVTNEIKIFMSYFSKSNNRIIENCMLSRDHDANFVQFVIEEKIIKEISHPIKGCRIIYHEKDQGKPTYAGRVIEINPDILVQSMWAELGEELITHKIWNIPWNYGNTCRFYKHINNNSNYFKKIQQLYHDFHKKLND